MARELFIEQDAHRSLEPQTRPQGPQSLALAKREFANALDQSLVLTAPEQSSDFIMVSEEGNIQLITAILKNEAEIAIAAAFEKLVA